MAKIEDLVEQIADPGLRSELQIQLQGLKRRQAFGLVFEEHEPEVTLLNQPPVSGGLAIDRTQLESPVYRVQSIEGADATVVSTANGHLESIANRRIAEYQGKYGYKIA